MKLIIILIILFLPQISFAKRPGWINSPLEFCKASEICVVGEGSGHMVAEANARSEMAKIFETKIQSSTKVQKVAHTRSDAGGIIDAEVDEDFSKTIIEKTEQVLKGIIIKEKFEDTESVFALASLNKRKGANILKGEMVQIDKEIVGFYKDGRRSSLNKILKEMKVRRNLNYKYEFLRDKKYPEKITYEQVQKRKRAKRALATVIFLDIPKGDFEKDLERIFIKQLLDDDFRIVLDKTKKHKYSIKVSLFALEQHMNVKNFVKHKFVMKISSKNSKGTSMGALNFETIQIGRSYMQAKDNAFKPLRDFIEDKLNELNID